MPAISIILTAAAIFTATEAKAQELREAPPQACYITFSTGKERFTCSGTLISERIVVTAANCLVDQYKKIDGDIKVGCGIESQSRGGGDFEFRGEYSTYGIKIGSGWMNPDGPRDVGSDFAFLVLNRPVIGIRPMQVPATLEKFEQEFLQLSTVSTGNYELRPLIECRLSGFGYDEISKKNHFRTVDKSPRYNLRGFVSIDSSRNATLAVSEWARTAEAIRPGDSGGAFYCRESSQNPWTLVAVVSTMTYNRTTGNSTGGFYALTASAKFVDSLRSLENEISQLHLNSPSLIVQFRPPLVA